MFINYLVVHLVMLHYALSCQFTSFHNVPFLIRVSCWVMSYFIVSCYDMPGFDVSFLIMLSYCLMSCFVALLCYFVSCCHIESFCVLPLHQFSAPCRIPFRHVYIKGAALFVQFWRKLKTKQIKLTLVVYGGTLWMRVGNCVHLQSDRINL